MSTDESATTAAQAAPTPIRGAGQAGPTPQRGLPIGYRQGVISAITVILGFDLLFLRFGGSSSRRTGMRPPTPRSS